MVTVRDLKCLLRAGESSADLYQHPCISQSIRIQKSAKSRETELPGLQPVMASDF